MQMQQCSICQVVKPDSEFYVSGKYLYSHCKVCKREKDKNTYHNDEKDREDRKDRDKKSHRIRQLKAQIFAYDILAKSKCIDCGESRLETLDFDHVRDTKTRGISGMILKGLKISALEKEIAKCDVRCANCHRIKTFKQLGWSRSTWDAELAEIELANLIQNAPKRKPAPKRKRKTKA